ncbi:MAG: CBS domain-containing protein [Bacteriovorax sp.]|nr:CBS domain-containing protein [Bacteriovorax sp.]
MSDSNHKKILDQVHQANIGETPVSQYMDTPVLLLKSDFSIKSTIEIFRTHHISGAPIVDYQDKIIGVISEHDLLIQAASGQLSDHIIFKTNITSIHPDTTLKEVLVIFYKQKLKWMPIINKENYVLGVVSRIDVLNFIATHSDL